MQSRPFLLRLMLPFAIVIALIVIVCGAVIYFAGQRTVHQQQIQDLDRLTGLVRQWLAGSDNEITEPQREQLRGAAQVLQTRITLIDGTGRVLFETHSTPEQMENHNDRTEVMAARAEEVGSDIRKSRTVREDHVYVARLLDSNKPDGMVVRLSFPRHAWVGSELPVTAVVVTAILLSILTLIAFALLLHWRWIAPVRVLAGAAEQMAEGKWETRVQPAGADDLRAFSSRLNIVAAQAEKQLADLNSQRSDLQAMVDTLPDPIIVTDAQQRVALMNTAAAGLMELAPQQVLGKNIVSAVNDAALLDLFDQIAAGKAPREGSRILQKEVRLVRNGMRHTFQAVAAPMAAGGALLVLQDVTTLSSAMQMKTDFVANASHELRTPIAAIKIAFETLREVYREDPQQSERCIQIIDGHLRRLEEMLRDLLDLSRVESPDTKPQIAPVKLVDLFQFIRSTMGPVARQKQVDLLFTESDGGFAEFASDERLLNLILKNLVENSIKFTPSGGKITVSVAQQNGEVVLSVRDTGIGIAPEHIDRVFERFYQADVTRASGVGRGTGLGLAIVKHAVAALNGNVHLDSRPGAGTVVTCTFSNTSATQ
jgi:two-component system phosphate regulon sensor histidine kinase PhoR